MATQAANAGHKVEVDQSLTSRLVARVVMAGADFAWWCAMKIAPRSMLVRFLGVPPELEAEAPAAEGNGVRAVIESVLPVSARLPGLQIETMGDLESWPIEAIHAPTLIIAAADDLYNTLPGARHMAERLPGARLVVFETGGHLLVGRQDEVREAVADFLSAAGAQLAPEVAMHTMGGSLGGDNQGRHRRSAHAGKIRLKVGRRTYPILAAVDAWDRAATEVEMILDTLPLSVAVLRGGHIRGHAARQMQAV